MSVIVWALAGAAIALVGYGAWTLLRAADDDHATDLHHPPQKPRVVTEVDRTYDDDLWPSFVPERDRTFDDLCRLMASTFEEIRALPEAQREEWLA